MHHRSYRLVNMCVLSTAHCILVLCSHIETTVCVCVYPTRIPLMSSQSCQTKARGQSQDRCKSGRQDCLLTLRRSLLSLPLTFSVAASLGSDITRADTQACDFCCLLLSSERERKKIKIKITGRLTGSGRWGRTGSCLNRLFDERRASKLLQVDDQWFMEHASEPWPDASKQRGVIMTWDF